MKINDNTVHNRRVEATFDEDDIRAILTKYLVKDTGFKIDPRKTLIGVTFNQKTEGFNAPTYTVDVTMTNNLLGERKK